MHKHLRTGNTIWSSIKWCWTYSPTEIKRILPPEHSPIFCRNVAPLKTNENKRSCRNNSRVTSTFKKEEDENPSEWKQIQYITKMLITWLLLCWRLSSALHLFNFSDFWTNLVTVWNKVQAHRCVFYKLRARSSNSKKIMTHIFAILAFFAVAWNWTCISEVCLNVILAGMWLI